MASSSSYVQVYGQLGDVFTRISEAQAPEKFPVIENTLKYILTIYISCTTILTRYFSNCGSFFAAFSFSA
jgi:hypothetical protein